MVSNSPSLPEGQQSFFSFEDISKISLNSTRYESQDFLSKQLITYIGNKRALLPSINRILLDIGTKMGNRKLRTADLFAGSGAVARLLKQHSSLVIANDLETYSKIINSCFLSNKEDVPIEQIQEAVTRLNCLADSGEYVDGFIREMYAPKDEKNIQNTDRVFYTIENAKRLDSFAQWIASEDPAIQNYLLGPLMSKASKHTNTAGIFKGFYKNTETKIGAFGGAAGNALSRILGQIRLEIPVFSNFATEVKIFQSDACTLSIELPELDLVYLDPPYNQHPYGANYFMLNYLHDYIKPEQVSRVSGIPIDWNRSNFNIKSKAYISLKKTVEPLNAKFVLISFNDEGFIGIDEIRDLLGSLGKVNEVALAYNTYRGSRNLQSRNNKVFEHLFLLERR